VSYIYNRSKICCTHNHNSTEILTVVILYYLKSSLCLLLLRDSSFKCNPFTRFWSYDFKKRICCESVACAHICACMCIFEHTPFKNAVMPFCLLKSTVYNSWIGSKGTLFYKIFIWEWFTYKYEFYKKCKNWIWLIHSNTGKRKLVLRW